MRQHPIPAEFLGGCERMLTAGAYDTEDDCFRVLAFASPSGERTPTGERSRAGVDHVVSGM